MSVTVVRAAQAGVPESPAVAASTSRLGDAGSLGALRIDLPDRVASELRLWIHRVHDAGDSVAWPVILL